MALTIAAHTGTTTVAMLALTLAVVLATTARASHAVGDILLVRSPNPHGVPLHRRPEPSMVSRIPNDSHVRVVGRDRGNWYEVVTTSLDEPEPKHADGWIVEKYVVGTVEQNGGAWDHNIDGSDKSTAVPRCPSGSQCSPRGTEVSVQACRAGVDGATRVQWVCEDDDTDEDHCLKAGEFRESVSKWCPRDDDATEHVVELRSLKDFLRRDHDASVACHTIRYLNSGDNFNCWAYSDNTKKTESIDKMERGPNAEKTCSDWDKYVIQLVGNRLDFLARQTNNDNVVDEIINVDLRALRTYWYDMTSRACPGAF